MPVVPQSEIRVKCLACQFQKTGEKCNELIAKVFADFVLLFPQFPPHFRTSSSTGPKPKLFHCNTLELGGPKRRPSDAVRFSSCTCLSKIGILHIIDLFIGPFSDGPFSTPGVPENRSLALTGRFPSFKSCTPRLYCEFACPPTGVKTL